MSLPEYVLASLVAIDILLTALAFRHGRKHYVKKRAPRTIVKER